MIIQPSMVGYFGICLFLLTSQRNASNDPLAAALITIDLIRLNFSMRQSIFLKKLFLYRIMDAADTNCPLNIIQLEDIPMLNCKSTIKKNS